MARNSSRFATAREFAEVEQLLRQLEGRLARLGRSAASDMREAGSAIPGLVGDALSALTERLRDRFGDSAREAGDEAVRAGRRAWRAVEHEAGHRPLATLAVAAGLGLLVGILGHRS
jgi:ElaB/YqjD/DUF883 family membrane-anchored ribosome-binding protein